ncbi:hypothetical protein [Deinococcus navajonensis]|uniref:DUF11 domain-containing protein n=1 Tax=Deinococcus navajonensis TaxID=309884 RepID=A0ABV8XSX8_9DEIO
MKRRTSSIILSLLLGSALAQTSSPLLLSLSLSQVKTVTAGGKTTEMLVPAKGNVPGDLLSQLVTAKNTSTKALKNVRIPLNVPKATFYVAPEKGIDGARAEYSIDGGKTFAPAPLKKKITVTENGKSVTREVEVKPSEYQAVRWTIPELAPGQTLKLGYRIQVK